MSNRLRSSLTVLGIVIGIASVITLLGIGKGAQTEAEKQVQSLGTNLIFVRPGSSSTSSISLGQGTSQTLTYEDSQAIKRNCPAVLDVAPQYSSNLQAQYGERNTLTTVNATEPSYTTIRSFRPARGRFFNETEMREEARVCVLGDTVALDLFGNLDPLKKKILIRGELFDVIGIMEHKGANYNIDMDDQIFIPISTGYSALFGLSQVTGRTVKSILVEAKPQEDELAQFQITNLLRFRHNIVAPQGDDFMLRTQSDIMQAAQSITGVFSLLLGTTAGISLVVGGIGIMNIMLVSVTERTKEIGIRKAIGAKYNQILSQFVIEATLMSVSGGIVGILLGVGCSNALSTMANWKAIVSTESILLSFFVSLGIGLFFGIYPARKAAKLDPIVALRSE
ncbi:MAG: ABC transporter permease [Candidatus Melainabacteria bacterium]|nr:ABC transporter permease [Candidatus Melainabacteria bacterium]